MKKFLILISILVVSSNLMAQSVVNKRAKKSAPDLEFYDFKLGEVYIDGKFKFTVGIDGRPLNLEVVDAEPKRLFERNARKAIYKWKFKPKIVDGNAVEQPNMHYTMEFQLAE